MQEQHSWLQPALQRLQIDAMNDMQQAAWDAYKENDEIILLSTTGSGKTLAYLLPLVPQLLAQKKSTTAIIVVPSRELALQIESVFKQMQLGIKITACYGGHKREVEENNLLDAPAIIVGTPGRLGDHLRRGNIKTAEITALVLDEFDKSLELGFRDEMAFLNSQLPNLRKKVLISATERELPEFLGLTSPASLNFLEATKISAGMLSVQILRTHSANKLSELFRLLCYLGNRSTIVFCNHRDAVAETSEWLQQNSIVNVYYHGALEQRDREIALAKFRNGSSSVLVTTDLASRGLDIYNVRYIIHLQLPGTEGIFTHRNGRTARMEASGTAILMIGPNEYIPPYVRQDSPVIQLPENPALPDKPKWTTLYIAAGKKDKVNKIDIVGFLSRKGELKKEDIGLIEVKDFSALVAINKAKASHVLQLIKEEKLKNKKIKIAVAR